MAVGVGGAPLSGGGTAPDEAVVVIGFALAEGAPDATFAEVDGFADAEAGVAG